MVRSPFKNKNYFVRKAVVLFLIVFLLACCANLKNQAVLSNNDLIIKQVYSQKLVPGTKDKESEYFIFMSIDLPKDIRLDSIYYNSVYFKIIQSGLSSDF